MRLRRVRWCADARRDPVQTAAHAAFRQGDYGAAWDLLSQTVLPEAADDCLEMLLMLATSIVSAYGAEALQRGLAFVERAEARSSTIGAQDRARHPLEAVKERCGIG